jgi:hypothetical protein
MRLEASAAPACLEVTMLTICRHLHLPAMLLAVTAAAAPACATPFYQSRGGYPQSFDRRAYDNGYREGLARGRDDARRGREFSYARDDEYRDADKGYRRQYGNRDAYRRMFRQGFQAGYTESFNRFARAFPRTTPFPRGTRPPLGTRSPVYVSPAAQVGYRDGFEAGRNDARNRGRFAPERSSRYRSADRDYDRRYGSKDDYKREYRVAFQRGYEDGFTGARS